VKVESIDHATGLSEEGVTEECNDGSLEGNVTV
jgi:hypothetical protein